MAKLSSSPNRLLASLPPADFELLRPHLKPIELVHGAILLETGDTIDRVYFPHSGIISLVVDLASGQTIEAAMVGRDSMLGGAAALDGQISLNKAIVQLAGAGETLDVERFRRVAEKSPDFRTTLLRHEQVLFAQSQQSTACNASHTIEARLAVVVVVAILDGMRHTSADAGISCADAWCATEQRFTRREYPPTGWAYHLQPGTH
jgi:CRP-like cAMP-binding protein